MDLIIFTKQITLVQGVTTERYSILPTDQNPVFGYDDTVNYLNTNKERYRIAINSNQEMIYYGTRNDAFLQDEFYFLNKILGFPVDFMVASKDLGSNVSVMRNWELGGALEDQLWDLSPGTFGTDPTLWGQFQKPNPGMLLLTEQLCKYFFDDGEYERRIYVGNNPSSTTSMMYGDKPAAEAAGFEFYTLREFLEEFAPTSSKSNRKSSFDEYMENLPSRRIGKENSVV